jgi:hypothetical protein
MTADRRIRFVRFRPDDPTEVAELRRQRVVRSVPLAPRL